MWSTSKSNKGKKAQVKGVEKLLVRILFIDFSFSFLEKKREKSQVKEEK